ncbi:MAG: zinc-ribbon domain-containing protein [Parvularcula sp.]
MLISCPTCPKQYNIPASDIPPEGRDVRCANCGTVWHEQGIEAEVLEAQPDVPIDSDKALRLLTKILHDQVAEAKDTMAEIEALEQASSAPILSPAVNPSASEPDAEMVRSSSTAMVVVEQPATDIVPQLTGQPRHTFFKDAPRSENPPRPNQRPQPSRDGGPMGHSARPARDLVDRVRLHWSAWRDSRAQARAVPPGNAAAQAFRHRAKAHYRNRLTPGRSVGWIAYAASVAVLSVGFFTFQKPIEEAFPASAKIYARLTPAPERPLSVSGLSTRYVQSLSGPVLEIRGTVENSGQEAVIPAMALTAVTPSGDMPRPLSISSTPLPSGGSRPFVVRAQLPARATRAFIEVNPASTDTSQNRYVFQQIGSGWGER